MREFKKRRNKKEEIVAFAIKSVGAIVLALVTVFLMRAAWGMYYKMAAASKAQDEAQSQLASVGAQKSGVNATLTEITSARGVEQQIRERYGVVKPGEGEIDVIRSTTASTTAPVSDNRWWIRIWHTLMVW